jgi:hypothetical protein
MGDIDKVAKIREAGDRLASTEAGKPIADTLEDKGTRIQFSETDEGTIAQFDPAENEITINDECHEASLNVLAAHLAHEGTHVQWDKPNSIEQEYHAFKAQAEVWKELKGDEADEQCDTVAKIMDLDEEDAKQIIRNLYRDLPEY